MARTIDPAERAKIRRRMVSETQSSMQHKLNMGRGVNIDKLDPMYLKQLKRLAKYQKGGIEKSEIERAPHINLSGPGDYDLPQLTGKEQPDSHKKNAPAFSMGK